MSDEYTTLRTETNLTVLKEEALISFNKELYYGVLQSVNKQHGIYMLDVVHVAPEEGNYSEVDLVVVSPLHQTVLDSEINTLMFTAKRTSWRHWGVEPPSTYEDDDEAKEEHF